MECVNKYVNRFTPSELEELTGGKLVEAGGAGRPASRRREMRISIDTRTIAVGDCYIAIRGEIQDGHKYIPEALRRGAGMIIAERALTAEELPAGYTLGGVVSSLPAPPPPPQCAHACSHCDTECEGCAGEGSGGDAMPQSWREALATLNECASPLLLVPDSTRALGEIAAEARRRAGAQTVAVTGSVGKTTTKELLAALLSRRGRTHMTEGNLNNQLGLPLTLLRLGGTEWASVLELGMNAPGEISKLSRICAPDAAVITCVGTSHIGFFGTREAIRDAKCEICDGLRDGGLLVLDGDEPLLSPGEPAIKGLYDRFRVLRVGEGEDCDVRLLASRGAGDCEWTEFDLSLRGRILSSLRIPAVGRHILRDAAMAVAVADDFGLTEEELREGLAAYRPAGMRQRILREGGVTVILDCYNASPESMKAALGVLGETEKSGRRIAVLGDMFELGEASAELHREVGAEVARSGADMLLALGDDARYIVQGAVEGGMAEENVKLFPGLSDESAEALREYISSVARAGDALLFKASRAAALERALPWEREET